MNLFQFLASLFSRKRASEPKPHTPRKPGEAQPIGGNAEIIVTRPGSSESVATRDFDRTNEPPMIVVPQPGDFWDNGAWNRRLSDHFALAEFIASDTARAKRIDNTLPSELLANARATCQGLEKIRAALGNRAIILLSGYRCRRLNEAVGGAPDSDHMKALAADFICPAFGTPYDIAKALSMLELQFDQLILEPTWVHIGFGPAMRGQLLTKLKSGGYLDGIVHGVHA